MYRAALNAGGTKGFLRTVGPVSPRSEYNALSETTASNEFRIVVESVKKEFRDPASTITRSHRLSNNFSRERPMSFDGVNSHAANTTASGKQSTAGLRSIIQEAIAIGIIAVSATQIWTLLEVRKTVDAHNESVNRSVNLAHANALVTERALAHLEERQASKQASEFRVPAMEKRTEQADSTRPAGEGSHNRPQSPTQKPPLFQWPE